MSRPRSLSPLPFNFKPLMNAEKRQYCFQRIMPYALEAVKIP